MCKTLLKYKLIEETIPNGCHTFPRISNRIEDREEVTLSCACSVVVDLISDNKEKVFLQGLITDESDYLSVILRDKIVKVFQKDGFKTQEKLLVTFSLLYKILYDDNIDEDNLIEIVDNYIDDKNINQLCKDYQRVVINKNQGFVEVNNLFLNIIENYKNVPIFKELMKDISKLGKKVDFDYLQSEWSQFKEIYEKHEFFLENCLVSKIYSNLLSDNIDDMVISLQIIILEYILVRHALFLQYHLSGEIYIENLKDYIMAFSRIIGNNDEAIIEFVFSNFEDYIFDNGYLNSIMMY